MNNAQNGTAYLYQPADQPEFPWKTFRNYYNLPQDGSRDNEAISKTYGGQRLTWKDVDNLSEEERGQRTILDIITFDIVDLSTLTVNFTIEKELNPSARKISVKNMSFRQLIPESSVIPMAGSNWESLKDSQARLEICQTELARWSLILKKDGVNAPDLSIDGDWCYGLELVNNCTTSWGFEIKILLLNSEDKLEEYHASFSMPFEFYKQLCQQQAGALSRQGFTPPEGFPALDARLLDEGNNVTFANIYDNSYHAHHAIGLDLERYRTLAGLVFEKRDLTLETGRIDYERWGGTETEYYQKPKVRKLVVHPTSKMPSPVDPPINYADIQDRIPFCRVPLFFPDGVYHVDSPVSVENYSQISDFSKISLFRTDNNLFEIVIEPESPVFDPFKLHQIVIGNLDLKGVMSSREFVTIDRFCLNPRPTTSIYNKSWLPGVLSEGGIKSAKFAVLFGDLMDSNSKRIFIQPESFGIERAILQWNGDKNQLIVDLISYERIMPVWQGTVEINPTELT